MDAYGFSYNYLAAAGKAKPERVYDAIDSGVLAMDAYVFS